MRKSGINWDQDNNTPRLLVGGTVNERAHMVQHQINNHLIKNRKCLLFDWYGHYKELGHHSGIQYVEVRDKMLFDPFELLLDCTDVQSRRMHILTLQNFLSMLISEYGLEEKKMVIETLEDMFPADSSVYNFVDSPFNHFCERLKYNSHIGKKLFNELAKYIPMFSENKKLDLKQRLCVVTFQHVENINLLTPLTYIYFYKIWDSIIHSSDIYSIFINEIGQLGLGNQVEELFYRCIFSKKYQFPFILTSSSVNQLLSSSNMKRILFNIPSLVLLPHWDLSISDFDIDVFHELPIKQAMKMLHQLQHGKAIVVNENYIKVISI